MEAAVVVVVVVNVSPGFGLDQVGNGFDGFDHVGRGTGEGGKLVTTTADAVKALCS